MKSTSRVSVSGELFLLSSSNLKIYFPGVVLIVHRINFNNSVLGGFGELFVAYCIALQFLFKIFFLPAIFSCGKYLFKPKANW
jgi:hypothetical protein